MQAKRTAEGCDQAVELEDGEAPAVQPRVATILSLVPSSLPLSSFAAIFRRHLLAQCSDVGGIAHSSCKTSLIMPNFKMDDAPKEHMYEPIDIELEQMDHSRFAPAAQTIPQLCL